MNIYGGSGHAKVVIGVVTSQQLQVESVYDDNPAVTRILDFFVDHRLTPEMQKKGTLIAIGNNKIRKKIANEFSGPFFRSVCHSLAAVDATVILGEGTVVMANAAINAEAVIGKHCIINTGAVVEHDCNLADFVHISPNCTLAGGVIVGEGTQIGVGAAVIPGIRIGKWAIVGAGAVIVEDIPDRATVVGNPGRILK